MSTHSLTTALTLYRSRTLSLSQAARQAGCTEVEFVNVLGKRGISVRGTQSPGGTLDNSTATLI